MDKIRTLIVDDEPVARRRIRHMLEDGPGVEVVGECSDGFQAMSAIRECDPNLLFLDVHLPDVDGFSVLQSVPREQMPAVIFTTGFDRMALRLFEAHGVDYLLKPFDRDRLLHALRCARQQLLRGPAETLSPALLSMLREASTRRPPVDRLRVSSRGRILLLRTADIDWIDAVGNYARLHVGTATHRLRERLKELEVRLDPGQFMRIHRSTIVNVDRIKELQQGPHRECWVLLQDGTKLVASRSYAQRVKRLTN